MTKTDLKEAATLLRAVIACVLASATGASIQAGADLYRQCGALTAGAEAAILSRALGAPLLGCFEAAYAAGATLATILEVRALIEGQAPVGRPAKAVQAAALRMSLIEYARIIASTDIVSRQDADALLADVNTSFDTAESAAADQGATSTYRALVSLHAAVAFDLATRSRPLPRMVTFSFPRRMPALTLSQRLYSDGSRADELVAENKIMHPLFCPPTGRALSA